MSRRVHAVFTRSTTSSFTVKDVNTDIQNTPTTIVLVDPTSPDGETSLGLIDDGVENLSLVVLLTGRASNALRDYANGEGTTVSSAAWTYLDRLTPRVMGRGRRVEHIVANGPDTANELAAVAADRDAGAIVLPASTRRLEPAVVDRLERLTPVPVMVAELADHNA
jgi:hypothetical protein